MKGRTNKPPELLGHVPGKVVWLAHRHGCEMRGCGGAQDPQLCKLNGPENPRILNPCQMVCSDNFKLPCRQAFGSPLPPHAAKVHFQGKQVQAHALCRRHSRPQDKAERCQLGSREHFVAREETL